jgi:MFS family permease
MADVYLESPDFNNPQGAILGLLTAILMLGAIVATPFISVVGDRWGRRVVNIFGSIIMGVGGVLQGASVNSQSRARLRFRDT